MSEMKWATSKRCHKHNISFTISNLGGSCQQCLDEFHLESGASNEPEATAAKPQRYNSKGTLEVWDAIEQLGLSYKQGNVLKYIYRYEEKNGAEDLVKAINYTIKMISDRTGEDYYELRKLTPEELAKKVKGK